MTVVYEASAADSFTNIVVRSHVSMRRRDKKVHPFILNTFLFSLMEGQISPISSLLIRPCANHIKLNSKFRALYITLSAFHASRPAHALTMRAYLTGELIFFLD